MFADNWGEEDKGRERGEKGERKREKERERERKREKEREKEELKLTGNKFLQWKEFLCKYYPPKKKKLKKKKRNTLTKTRINKNKDITIKINKPALIDFFHQFV